MVDIMVMKSENFKAVNASEYFVAYSQGLAKILEKVDTKTIDKAFVILTEATDQGHHVFVAGNGGSAAIANHLCCDWTKGTFTPRQKPLVTHSLSANSSMLTAVSNDLGFDQSFSKQVEMMAKVDDVLVLISSSGNSPNIIKAAETAKSMGLKVIGLTGFDGGGLAKLSDAHIHVPAHNYGLVEDSHQMIMHSLAQFIFEKKRL